MAVLKYYDYDAAHMCAEARIIDNKTGSQVCACYGFCDDRNYPELTVYIVCDYRGKLTTVRNIAMAT